LSFRCRPRPTTTVWHCRTYSLETFLPPPTFATMMRGRFNAPDLDVLDSPLMSSSPFSALGGVPGSALAERIFNDPDSWEDTDGDEDDDYPEDVEHDTLAWLTEEIERFRAHSSGVETNGTFDLPPPIPQDTKSHLTVPEEKPGPLNIGWKGINRKSGVRPISLAGLFENTDDDFSSDIQHQLSKILESGGIPHQIRPRPLSSTTSSPPSTSGSLVSAGSSVDSPLQISTAVTSNSGNMSPSPVAVYSASATLSFLEWYGIYPDSPLLDANNRKSLVQRKKSMRKKTPGLQVPTSALPSRPSSLLSISTAATTETFRQPSATKRLSPAPPPGLDVPATAPLEDVRPKPEVKAPSPPGLSRSPSPPNARDQKEVPATPARKQSLPLPSTPGSEAASTPARSNSDSSPRGRPLPTALPPPYSGSPSAAGKSESTGSSAGNSPTEPQRKGSAALVRRRLPSIPPETPSSSRPATPSRPPNPTRHTSPSPAPAERVPLPSRHTSPAPPPQKPATAPSATPVVTAQAPIPPPPPFPSISSHAPPSFASFSLTSAAMASSTYSPSPLSGVASPGCHSAALASATTPMGGRPASSIRSPLGGPAGPRTRSRASQDAGARARALPIGHRPPVLRL